MAKKRKNTKKELKRIKNILTVLTCILVVIVIILFVYILKMKNDFNNKKITYEKQISEYEKPGNENYVLLGDSLTDWYPISDFFSDKYPIINSGFAGFKTGDLLRDMDKTVYRYNPTKVFIQIGTNDLNGSDPNIDEAYNNIVQIINNIKENRPKAEIYFESLYPVNRSIEEKGAEERENADIIALNEKISNYCKDNNVTYMDMYKLLSDENGELKREYTSDGLHLSTEGYTVLSNELKKYMKEF